ncbi:hypothetical protein KR054_004358 [Drosophila jambulina]|nr:hypothetical protein KR054_004358 [Drosophila jambulina]
MHLIKVAFLLSFLALCHRPQVEAALGPRLTKTLLCAELATDAAAQIIESSVTGLKVLADCAQFKPTLKLNGSIVRFIKLAYQFIRKIIHEKRLCLINLFTSTVNLIRPAVAEFEQLDCLNPEV